LGPKPSALYTVYTDLLFCYDRVHSHKVGLVVTTDKCHTFILNSGSGVPEQSNGDTSFRDVPSPHQKMSLCSLYIVILYTRQIYLIFVLEEGLVIISVYFSHVFPINKTSNANILQKAKTLLSRIELRFDLLSGPYWGWITKRSMDKNLSTFPYITKTFIALCIYIIKMNYQLTEWKKKCVIKYAYSWGPTLASLCAAVMTLLPELSLLKS